MTAFFWMFDNFMPGSPRMYGELEGKLKRGIPQLEDIKEKLSKAVVKHIAGPHANLRAAAKAGEAIVRLTSIQESHIKTIGYLEAYKKPCLIKVAKWICKQFMAIAHDYVWVNDCTHKEFERNLNSFLE